MSDFVVLGEEPTPTVNPFEQPKTVALRNVSNSEVTTFLSCLRQYDFAFIEELTPIKTADPLARGSGFHYGMELYWQKRIEGASHDEAFQYALMNGFSELPDGWSLEMLMQSQFLFQRFVTFHNGWPDWKPLGTEIKLTLPIGPTLAISIKYDFYYYDIPRKKYVLLDWKVTYDFWRDDDHELNGQMPKYIAVLQANKFPVDEGSLAEIRSRSLGKEKSANPRNLWKYTRYNPSEAKKRAVLQQHIVTAMKIEKHRALSPEERLIESQPVLNKHGACKYCDFTALCTAMNEGKKDLSVDIRVGYKHNDYVDQHNESIGTLPNVDF